MSINARLIQIRNAQRREWLLNQRINGHLRCVYCGIVCSSKTRTNPNSATVDHKIPIVRCGTDDPSNWAVCCRQCNQRKDCRTDAEYLRELARINAERGGAA